MISPVFPVELPAAAVRDPLGAPQKLFALSQQTARPLPANRSGAGEGDDGQEQCADEHVEAGSVELRWLRRHEALEESRLLFSGSRRDGAIDQADECGPVGAERRGQSRANVVEAGPQI